MHRQKQEEGPAREIAYLDLEIECDSKTHELSAKLAPEHERGLRLEFRTDTKPGMKRKSTHCARE